MVELSKDRLEDFYRNRKQFFESSLDKGPAIRLYKLHDEFIFQFITDKKIIELVYDNLEDAVNRTLEQTNILTNDDIAKLTYLLETKNIITKNYGY